MKTTLLLALSISVASAWPTQYMRGEVPQEHSHEQFLTYPLLECTLILALFEHSSKRAILSRLSILSSGCSAMLQLLVEQGK
jgi:hypothetical protein